MLHQRPIDLFDKLIDFTDAFRSFQSAVQLLQTDGAVTYTLLRSGGQSYGVGTVIDENGNDLGGALYSRTNTPGARLRFVRKTPIPGIYSDRVDYFTGFTNSSNNNNPYTGFDQSVLQLTDSITCSYIVLQKAVAVMSVNGLPASQNQIFTQVLNDILTFDSTNSRGADVSSVKKVEIQGADGSWANAVLGNDYSFTVGSLSTAITSIKLLTAGANYRVTTSVSGYTSYNNPYNSSFGSNSSDFGRTLVSSNDDSMSVLISTGAAAVVSAITFPQVDVVLNTTALISSSPFTTYTNTNILASANIDYATGSWIVGGVTKPTSNNDWDTEIAANCRITLHVVDKLTGIDVVTPLAGVGPHQLALPNSGKYFFKFITSLK